MAGFTCPFCRQIMSINESTKSEFNITFKEAARRTKFIGVGPGAGAIPQPPNYRIRLDIFRCPNCSEETYAAKGTGEKMSFDSFSIYPNSFAKKYPDYIPLPIREDYEEAYAIINLSPKASATLSRRCLQGMIRDFWNISKNRLIDEIDELKDLVPATQWRVIDGIRRIGNIGAHMEKDVNLIVDIEPYEAEKLIKVIELLIEQWYIQRHEQEQLYTDIIEIDEAKKEQRKSP